MVWHFVHQIRCLSKYLVYLSRSMRFFPVFADEIPAKHTSVLGVRAVLYQMRSSERENIAG
jgi:hypothetical protein